MYRDRIKKGRKGGRSQLPDETENADDLFASSDNPPEMSPEGQHGSKPTPVAADRDAEGDYLI